MELIVGTKHDYHVSLDTVAEFENAILSDRRVHPLNSGHTLISRLGGYAWRVFDKIGRQTKMRLKPTLPRSIDLRKNRDYFVVMMSLNVQNLLPHFLFSGRKSIYLFDAWPCTHERIKDLVEQLGINKVFLSSAVAAERLNGFTDACTFSWIPEGVSPALYKYCTYAEKDIDVLQLGRKYDPLHDLIVEPLRRSGTVYMYEKVKGKIIFPTREEFIDGLARSKISICVPSSVTHPERSGDIETMTIRYLQSMVSKCLIVGHAPGEMISLFGYNPVIEINMQDPVNQIRSILDDFKTYIPLIEKNYRTVVEHHTWRDRWDCIADILFSKTCIAGRSNTGDFATR